MPPAPPPALHAENRRDRTRRREAVKMDLTLEPLGRPAEREIPRPAGPGGAPPRREPGSPIPRPIRLLPRDREEIARREARERHRRMLLNAAVGLVLLLLTALGIRYETRADRREAGPANGSRGVPPAEAVR